MTSPAPSTRRELRAQRSTPPTILFVCTGNICRSPMGEVVLRAALDDLDVRVHSAGTHGLVGRGMTQEAQDLALGLGAKSTDAEAHTARFLQEPLLRESDLVLTMTSDHRSHAVQLEPSQFRRTFTVREFARLSAVVPDSDITDAADAVGPIPRERLRAAIRIIADQRGSSSTPSSDDDNVIDPYRQSREIYEQSAAQLAPALAEVERVIRAALPPGH
ncbi:arsenate reductase/protein-tyrosine-phosphatase family protein [Microbacterium profundi]